MAVVSREFVRDWRATRDIDLALIAGGRRSRHREFGAAPVGWARLGDASWLAPFGGHPPVAARPGEHDPAGPARTRYQVCGRRRSGPDYRHRPRLPASRGRLLGGEKDAP